MKIKLIASAAILVSFLSACGDGVPKVADPHSPVVDGQKMTPKDFLNKYCIGKAESSTCQQVSNAMSKDATKGTLPKGW